MEAADNWELEEGIPQVEDPFIQKYLNGRDALILQEKKQRHGLLSSISGLDILLISTIY